MTKEEAVDIAKESFETGIKTSPKEPNQETEQFSYYLPGGLSIEEVAENNLILSKGDQLYLIFSNPVEEPSSQVNYDQDQLVEENSIVNETREIDGAFNYILVSPHEEDLYKVIVGTGAKKGTTITDLDNIKNSVETILTIIKSVSY
ncbi:hypothetical protein KHA80_15920 [Anaerobacillus sp. HL2]|nr:hypothetical protein KHA80_15920 [Anaerobacillus sp. HL2]